MNIQFTFLMCLLFFHGISTADESSFKVKSTIRSEGYLQYGEARSNDELPNYLVSNTLLSTPAMNLLSGSLNVSKNNWKAEISGITGTYAEENLAHEQGILKHIGSLWSAYQINEQTEILAGIYPSHIGLESPSGFDCINPSRSIVADNSPYYQSGIRIRHQVDNQTYTLHLLNGWQQSTIDSKGILPAIGYDYGGVTDNLQYVCAGFIGSTIHDSTYGVRIYQHIGATYKASSDVMISASIDIGTQKQKETIKWMMAPLLMMQWKLHAQWNLNGRLEYYHDPDFMIANAIQGITGFGYSCGLDFMPVNTVKCRIEYRNIRDIRNNVGSENTASYLGMHIQCFISSLLIGDHQENQ